MRIRCTIFHSLAGRTPTQTSSKTDHNDIKLILRNTYVVTNSERENGCVPSSFRRSPPLLARPSVIHLSPFISSISGIAAIMTEIGFFPPHQYAPGKGLVFMKPDLTE